MSFHLTHSQFVCGCGCMANNTSLTAEDPFQDFEGRHNRSTASVSHDVHQYHLFLMESVSLEAKNYFARNIKL